MRVQSILYNPGLDTIERVLEYLDNAALHGSKSGSVQRVTVALGDCSPSPALGPDVLLKLRRRLLNLGDIHYTHFGANLGPAAGHNRLLEGSADDFIMLLHPDALVAPTLFSVLLNALGRPGVGLVEARQLPIERLKEYDSETGETSWASMTCVVGRKKLFDELHGFDADAFFLCGADIDFSWRARLAGRKVVHQPSAVVFRDQRLSDQGQWIAGPAWRYYSAEAVLLLAYKYSRSDLTDRCFQIFTRSDDEAEREAAEAFETRRKAGRLPTPIDTDHLVARFIDGVFADQRFNNR